MVIYLQNQEKTANFHFIIYPRAIINMKYNDDVVQDKLMASIISFIYLYIIIFFVISAL